MKRNVYVFFLPFVFLSLVIGCREEAPTWRDHTFKKLDLSRTIFDAHLPTSLWEKIKAVLPMKLGAPPPAKGKQQQEENSKEAGDAAQTGVDASGGIDLGAGQLPSVFAPLRVYLIEKNKGILIHGNSEIILPSGGGEIDLNEYVHQKNGSFYFVAELLPGVADVDTKVFFMSKSRERRLGGDRYGSGCNTYFEVTSAFKKALATDGFLVNTTQGRHVSALAGVYFFAAARAGKLYLASLTIKDSVRRDLQCEK